MVTVALPSRATAASWSPDGHFVAVSRQTGGDSGHPAQGKKLLLVRTDSGQIVWKGTCDRTGGNQLVWSLSGRWLAVVDERWAAGGEQDTRHHLTVWRLAEKARLAKTFECPLAGPSSVAFSQTSDALLVEQPPQPWCDGPRSFQVITPANGRQWQVVADEAQWGYNGSIVTLRRVGTPSGSLGDGRPDACELALVDAASSADGAAGGPWAVPRATASAQSLWVGDGYSRVALVGRAEAEGQPWVAWLNMRQPPAAPLLPRRNFLYLSSVGNGVGPGRGLGAWAPRGPNENLLAVVTSQGDSVVVIDTWANESMVLTSVSSPLVRLSWSPCGQYLVVSDANLTAYTGRGQDRPTLRLQGFAVGRPPPAGGSNIGSVVPRPLHQLRELSAGARVQEACEARAISGVGTLPKFAQHLTLALWFLPTGTESFDFTPVAWSAPPGPADGD